MHVWPKTIFRTLRSASALIWTVPISAVSLAELSRVVPARTRKSSAGCWICAPQFVACVARNVNVMPPTMSIAGPVLRPVGVACGPVRRLPAPFTEFAVSVLPPAPRGTGLRRKDDGGGVNGRERDREKSWLQVLTPRAVRKRDSDERTMGVGLTD